MSSVLPGATLDSPGCRAQIGWDSTSPALPPSSDRLRNRLPWLHTHISDVKIAHRPHRKQETTANRLATRLPRRFYLLLAVVVFLHGFPEIWYTWRHQMVSMANNGYRAMAFDFRGYGLSEQPAEPEKATFKDLIDDVVGLLDSLGINKAFLVGKDFGAVPAYLVSTVYPERVLGVIALGIPFILPGPSAIQSHLLPKGFYITRWQEPGRSEADFGRFDVKTVMRNIYILFSRSEIPIAGDDQEIMDLFDPSTPLPPWFSEQDLSIYASLYEKSGFRFPLQVPYRCSSIDIGITNPKVTAPALLIVGENDYFLKFPGMEEYIKTGAVKNFVPDLDVTYLEEGSHFMHEQLPEQVNQLIITFLGKHSN